jgi:HTH-type transcriptional regulator, sugar sensing transcriptional regulator
MIEVLKEFGLTDAEAKVYLALLELGSTKAGPLIKKAGMHRATVYDCLKRLMEKGLVSYTLKVKMKFFEAAEPDVLMNLLMEKEEHFKEILPQLKSLRKMVEIKQEVNVYQGKRGVRTVLENILNEMKSGGEYADFGVSGLFRTVMGPYWDFWQKKKKEYKIKSKCIFDERLKSDRKFIGCYFGEARFHSKEFPSPTDTMIYNDKIILFIWTADPPLAVVIRNKRNAEGYRNQFNMMWKHAGR